MSITRALRLFLAALALAAAPTASLAGFFVSNGQLVDDNGTPFVMRGMAYPFAWYTQRYPAQTQQDFANMAATGANTVRIVLGTGGQFTRSTGAQLTNLIQWAKDNRMVAVLEVHDSTGWSESAGAVPISNAVSYWTSADIRAAINGQEDFVIVNIANEPFGNTTTSNYVPDTIAAITALRNAGLTHNLMVDAANWGQDWTNTMRQNAVQIWNADPQRNLTFSVHMYEVYAQASAITSYMQAFDDLALPLVVGEFGADHQGQAVDEATIMAQAQSRGNGYVGWSWSGNGSCCTSLDIVSNFGTTLTSWGNILVNGANGIRATSVVASVFGAPPTNSLNISTGTLALGAAASSATVNVTANVSWTVTDNQSWLSAAPASGTNNGSFTVSATANGGTADRSGTVTVSGGGLTRTISVTQSGTTAANFTVSAPATLSVTRGAGATAAINIARTSFPGSVVMSASGLPSGVTATFSPASTSANTSTLTVSASSTAALGTTSITITGTSGATVRTTTIALTVSGGGGTGPATASALVTSSSGWFTEQQLRLSHTAAISALTVTIVVQRTQGVSASGQYNSIGGQITQGNSSTAAAITYQFTLNAGQTLPPANNRAFAVQMGGTGTVHPSSGDAYTVSYTAAGQSYALSGTF